MTLTTGTKLGRYEIRSQLGAGGMGEVYLAQDTTLDRRVAIKFLRETLVADEQARKRLVREAQAAAKLDHANICSIHEVGEEDGRSFIVMQYVCQRRPDCQATVYLGHRRMLERPSSHPFEETTK